tara:strand:- start:31 stop:450 length:420 start_codon:yes stop_codon:yes gene_type:complete
MTLVFVGSAVVFAFFLGLLLFKAYQYKKEQRAIADMLHKEANKLIEHMRERYADEAAGEFPETSINSLFSDPKYLTTLVTVLVKNAGGEVRLDENDFLELSTDHYVSIYVDTDSNAILLRLNSLSPYLSLEGDDDPVYN